MPLNQQYFNPQSRPTSSALDLNRESIMLDIASRIARDDTSLDNSLGNITPRFSLGNNASLINTGINQMNKDPRYSFNEKVRGTEVTDTISGTEQVNPARQAGRRALEIAELELENGGGFQPIAEEEGFGLRIPNPTNAQVLGRNEGALGFNDLTRVGLDASQIDPSGNVARSYLRELLSSI